MIATVAAVGEAFRNARITAVSARLGALYASYWAAKKVEELWRSYSG